MFGAIDTLENLRKGGRIGGAAAAVGALLSIKPVVEVRGGVLEQESRQRTRVRSLQYLADKVRSAGPWSAWLPLVPMPRTSTSSLTCSPMSIRPTPACWAR